jgi:hypothetical protein
VLEETFSVTEDRFGEQVVVELRPGGASQDVTESNKDDYVDLVITHRTTGRIKEQFHAFMEGLSDVLLLDLLLVFDEHELELLIGGTKVIDMDDWTRFTDYRGYEKTDGVIKWFWACLRSWPAERKARLLQFTMGTSRVPVNGFKHLRGSGGLCRFTIERSGDPNGLPRSHTCFNRLYLPPYEDYESLESKLCFAIECVYRLLYVVLAHWDSQGDRRLLDGSSLKRSDYYYRDIELSRYAGTRITQTSRLFQLVSKRIHQYARTVRFSPFSFYEVCLPPPIPEVSDARNFRVASK